MRNKNEKSEIGGAISLFSFIEASFVPASILFIP
jgi:hypothetical protein